MKIYDGFLFNDELDLLELRLMELYDLVDVFVLCEMGHTFMQNRKPLHFLENVGRFQKWRDKIRLVECSDYPILPHPAMEHWQRSRLRDGLSDAAVGDVYMLSDVDEIPSREVVEKARSLPPEHPFVCVQKLYYYYVNLEMAQPWVGTTIGPVPAGGVPDLQRLRHVRLGLPRLWNSGWHFSWLGPVENIQSKLRAIDVVSDAKIYGTPGIVKPQPDDVEHIRRCLETGSDLFYRVDDYARKSPVPIEPGVRQPACIKVWLERHPQYELPMVLGEP